MLDPGSVFRLDPTPQLGTPVFAVTYRTQPPPPRWWHRWGWALWRWVIARWRRGWA